MRSLDHACMAWLPEFDQRPHRLEPEKMKRCCFALLVLVSAAANQGCQSCCSPHDYAPPVANYGHYHQGPGRAGSAISGGHTVSISQPPYIEGMEDDEVIDAVPPIPAPPREGRRSTSPTRAAR